ncbi:DUF6515 family protein [Cellulophaga fucicola]|nr:DUF6515 family protein [Cellulophaga fucicola]
MKTTLKFMFALVIMIGFTTNGFSQKKHIVVYVKTPKKVIKPTIGSIVYQLSKNAKKVVVNKSRYIKHNNVLYTKVIVKGRNAYKVVRYS